MLAFFLSRVIKDGTLEIIWPNGRRRVFGSGPPHAAIRLTDRSTPRAIALRPELAIGEAYMDGRLTVETGDLTDVLSILMSNASNPSRQSPLLLRPLRAFRLLRHSAAQVNSARRARRNAAHHYDLSGALYDLFLDDDRQYSCAYYDRPGIDLAAAQRAKKHHIIAKLHLDRPGLKVLEIGAGWGGLALEIAGEHTADVTSISLSTEQLAVCHRRVRAARLEDRCRFELRDYRAVSERFDRIVSIAMFEAVGLKHYDEYFGKIAELLEKDGAALVHTLGRSGTPGAVNPWLDKYIFPGSHAPSLSEMLPAIERAGLMVTDVEVLRAHYAHTLHAWRERFRANWAKAAAIYDERFCRMWDFYLAGCETTFRLGHHVVFQIQLARNVDALPITRDYMLETEQVLERRAAE
jgi:cyclopropane-fatty-acyl-phospholipid synthase